MSMSAADRISELPEAILHHILSYLPIRDAACTSVLSKWWNNAWKTLPYLNFNEENIMILNSIQYYRKHGKDGDLLAVVQRIVRSRREQEHSTASIEKFSLYIPPWEDQNLYRWLYELLPSEEKEKSREIGFLSFSVITYVITPFLKELELSSCTKFYSRLLILPPSLLSAKCLTSLTLKGFNLCLSWPSLDIKFMCLQKLALIGVVLDDNIFKNLTWGSRSSLEILELKYSRELKSIHLGGEFVKLKQLRVHCTRVLEVEVYDELEFEEVDVVDLFYLFYECNFNVKNCLRLRKVFLNGDYITENNLHQLLASSKHLEELNLSGSSLLKNINISSDSLKTLTLSFVHNFSTLHIFSPTLKSLTLKVTFQTPTDQLPNFSLNGINGVVLRVDLIMFKAEGNHYFRKAAVIYLRKDSEHDLVMMKMKDFCLKRRSEDLRMD